MNHNRRTGNGAVESLRLLATIVNATDDAVISANLDGRITSWNPAAERLFGYRADEIVGKPVSILHFPETNPTFKEVMVALSKGETFINVESVRKHKAGHAISVAITISPILDERDDLSGVCAIVRDDSKLKSAMQDLAFSEARFRQLAENIDAVFWYGDVECSGNNLYVSPAYEEIWGRPVESLRQSPRAWFDAIHPDDRARIEQATTKQTTGEYNEIYRIVRPDGGVRWIQDRAFPIRDESGTVVRIAGIAEDITHSKEFELQLQRKEELLRKLINLQESERMLIATDIHDGFTQEVVAAKMLVESVRSDLDGMRPSILTKLEMVEQYLAYAIAEARRMISEVRPMVIAEAGIVEAINHLISELEAKNDIVIAFKQQVRFERLDPMLEGAMYRIVQEALTNAQRHSGCHRVEISLLQIREKIRLEVRDRGKGFNPDAVPRERFGLIGIQERARLFGGNARVISSPGRGTQIVVELDLRPDSARLI